MSEEGKTISFLVLALVSGIFAIWVSLEAPEKTGDDEIGELFVEIEDPLDVSRLKIVQFDTAEGKADPFEIAKVDGRFSIPSHQNYPADQSDHLVEAVTGFNKVEILASASDSSGAHEEFGVLDPTDEQKAEKGAEGVGVRITLSDDKNQPLADFVVGKKVKGTENQYYVRHAGNDHVYTVAINPEDLSTKFEDWIERDLLKLDPLKLSGVIISDYSVVTRPVEMNVGNFTRIVNRTVLERNSEIELRYDQQDLKWQLDRLIEFKGADEPELHQLADNEELNKKSLDDLKYAVDDLEIVDVRRQGKRSSNDFDVLIKTNAEAVRSLGEHGFFFGKEQDKSVLLSNNGQVTIGMDDGVQYVLKFGNVAGAEKSEQVDEDNDKNQADGDETQSEEEAADGEEQDDDQSGKLLRHLMVLAEFNQDLIELPDYDEVPPETPPAEPAKPAETNGIEKGGEATDNANSEPAAEPAAAGEESQDAGTDAALPEQEGDEPAVVGGCDGEGEDEAEGADPAEDEAEEADPAEDEAAKMAAWKAKRERIIKDNQRKKKDYEEKVAAGKKRVEELNGRFSEWYYVIADDTYKKIHLTRSDVVKEKEKEETTEEGGEGPAANKSDAIQRLNDLKNALPPAPAGAAE